MMNFKLRRIPDIFFGRSAVRRAGSKVRHLGAKSVMILHDANQSVDLAVAHTTDALDAEKLQYSTCPIQSATCAAVRKATSAIRDKNCDFVLAVGGGTVIDTAKAAALCVLSDVDVWDFFTGVAQPDSVLPFGVIVTNAGSGSEWSNRAALLNEQCKRKHDIKEIDDIRPRFSLLNPEYTFTVPGHKTAEGAATILAHLTDRYCTLSDSSYFQRQMLAAGYRTLLQSAPNAIAEPNNYAARSDLMIVAPFANSGLLEYGLVGDGGLTPLAQALTALTSISHGAALAALLPAWMRHNFKTAPILFANLAMDAFGLSCDLAHPELTAYEGVERLVTFLAKLGLPCSLRNAGCDLDDVVLNDLLQHISFGQSGTIGNTFPMGPYDVKQLLRAAQ